ncbi:MAG: cysteine desulfurase family protein [Methylobacter sp.]|nr:cysteine desulfurase family protein [Methylobacter sp.]
MIYFDHNATTPIDDRVLDTMLPYLKTFYGNASSLYRPGRIVRSAIDTAREQVAALVGVQPAQIVFTSGGTEANNLALATLVSKSRFAISAIEHPSITEQALHLKSRGHDLAIINVDANGVIIQEAIDKVIQYKPKLVSIMLANNETGVVQKLSQYTRQLRENGSIVHTDAVQGLGKIPVAFNELGVHLMSLSSHKIYGPKGSGALVFEKSVKINPVFLGGGQEQELRAGTENAAAIIGFGKAAELAQAELAQRSEYLLTLRKVLEEGLLTIPGLTIFSHHGDRLPNTVQFGLPETDGEMLVMKLDQKGFAVSSGSACASGGKEPSSVLTAMGVDPNYAKSAIRVSLGKANTEAEVIKFINQLKLLVCQG